MHLKLINNADVSYLDEVLLDEQGFPKPVYFDQIKDVSQEDISLWCVRHAVYQLPIVELIDWIKEKIGDRKAIEIGSGEAGIGKFAGITSTDSYLQTTPELVAYYNSLQQKPTSPPEYVERLDAHQAIEKYNPEVVLGCFITHKYRNGDKAGNMFGPEEEDIIKQATYIHVGNEATHSGKHILKSPHDSYKFDWLVSRSFDKSKNVIWCWNHND